MHHQQKMSSMKNYITACLWLLSLKVISQPAAKNITGKVANMQNQPVAAATVKLLNAADSVFIKGSTTNGDGKFNFTHLPNGNYLLTVTAIGLQQQQPVAVHVDDAHINYAIPVIVLQPAGGKMLANVVVTAKKQLIQQDIDKTVVNVDAMISSATSNTYEVLQKTPGVTVSSSGDISLNGRGVLVLIDGRSTYMAGQDLASYLKSLPGAILDKIELIDNPSSRYDASGNAIINIRLKKNRAGGFTGNISAGYSQGIYARHNDAVNINYNVKKLNLFANVGYNHEKDFTGDVYNRLFYNNANMLTSGVALTNNQYSMPTGVNINLGADYTATANTTYGVTFNLNTTRRNGLLYYTSNGYNAGHQTDTAGNGSTVSTDKRTNMGIGFNAVHKFGNTGRELSADVNYLHYTATANQVLTGDVYDADKNLISNNMFLYVLPYGINIYTAKADYTHPFKNKAKVEAGIKTSVVDNDNTANYYTLQNGAQVIDNTMSNHFNYNENINAAYINGQKSWNRFGIQLGLRAENTRATGNQLGNDSIGASRFTKNYTKLFPAFFTTYKLDSNGNSTLSFAITKRISRPNYQLLNPFEFVKDKYSYTQGNPMLVPQYQMRYELRWVYKQLVRIGLSYNSFTNLIFTTTQTVNNIFITHPENVGHGYMLLLNTGLSASPAKWWRLNSDILLSRMGLNGMSDGVRLNPSTYVARLNLYNQWQFKAGWSAEWGAYYASNDLNGQTFTGGMFRAWGSIQKKLWKDKGSIRVGMEDIFNTWVYHLHSIDLKQAQYFQTSETDTRRFTIGFTYRFGNDLFARKSKHTNNASDEEKGRIQ